jgi:hypothetical protein
VRRAFALVVLATLPVSAQDMSERIPIGSRVELRTRGMIVESLRGDATEVDTTGIELAVTRAGTTVFIPWTSVASLDWGTPKSRVRGVRDGAIIGFLLGAALFVNSYPWNAPDASADTIRGRLFAVSSTIAVGSTLIGFAAGSRKWRSAPITRSNVAPVALVFHPDDAVRIESTLGRFVGRSAVAGDSLRLVTSAGPVTLPWRNVGDVQALAGRNRLLGILYGAAIGYGVSSVSDAFIRVPTSAYLTNVALAGVLGFRELSPTGWTSLPQPHR